MSKRPGQKKNLIQKVKLSTKVAAKKASQDQVKALAEEDKQRRAREEIRQEMLERLVKDVKKLRKHRKLYFITSVVFLVTTIIAGVI